MKKDVIEAFAKKLRHNDEVMYATVYEVYHNDEYDCESVYENYINVCDLDDAEIAEIAEYIGKTIYRYSPDNATICLNPDEDEVECGIWEEVK